MQNDLRGKYLSTQAIEERALEVRDKLGLRPRAVFDIVGVLEKRLCKIIPGFQIQRVPEREMGEVEAFMAYDPPRMMVRQDVELLARYHEPRCRFTFAHETGHAILHPNVQMPRKAISNQRAEYINRNESLEGQANIFAGFFLMPRILTIEFDEPVALARHCKVTEDAAEVHMRMLELWPKRNGRVIEGFQDVLAHLRDAERANDELQKLEAALQIVLLDMLKWEFKKEIDTSILAISMEARRLEIQRIIANRPALQSRIPDVLPRAYREARTRAEREPGVDASLVPSTCPFSLEYVISGEFPF
jgi:hypothetical protein